MPCFDPRDHAWEQHQRKAESILCGIIRRHGIAVLDGVDWEQAGVSKDDALQWWEDHQKEDLEG